MKPPMPWMGGKQSLVAILVSLFPLFFNKYVEAFGGGGALLFHKEPSQEEIYNDKNHLLFNFFLCVQEFVEQLIDELELTINSREFFKHNRNHLKRKVEPPDVIMAAKYYQTVIQSYAAGVTSFGGAPRGMWRRFPAIRAASGRLQDVVVENMDFEPLFLKHDAKGVLTYFDPPYYDAEGCYENVGFGKEDHLRLFELLANAIGYILLSYNHCDEIVELYSKPGFMIIATSRLSNIAQRYKAGEQYGELIIGNYNLLERSKSCRQLTLWGDAPMEIDERNVIYDGISAYPHTNRGL